jgi:hypothetical protein
MAFTASSTLGEVLKAKPKAKEVIVKHAGRPIDEAQLSMAMGMSLQQIAGFVGWDQAKIQALVKDLNEL